MVLHWELSPRLADVPCFSALYTLSKYIKSWIMKRNMVHHTLVILLQLCVQSCVSVFMIENGVIVASIQWPWGVWSATVLFIQSHKHCERQSMRKQSQLISTVWSCYHFNAKTEGGNHQTRNRVIRVAGRDIYHHKIDYLFAYHSRKGSTSKHILFLILNIVFQNTKMNNKHWKITASLLLLFFFKQLLFLWWWC